MIELPPCEGIIILNLSSWGSGANPWGTAKEESGFLHPRHDDGLLEVLLKLIRFLVAIILR